MTGLAQVRGFRGEARTREEIAARLQSDLVYLQNWSLMLDLVTLVRTVWQMIFPPHRPLISHRILPCVFPLASHCWCR